MSHMEAQIIEKNGRKAFAVLPYAQFLRLREELEDYEDLRCLRQAKEREGKAATIGLAEIKRRLSGRAKHGLGPRKRSS